MLLEEKSWYYTRTVQVKEGIPLLLGTFSPNLPKYSNNIATAEAIYLY